MATGGFVFLLWLREQENFTSYQKTLPKSEPSSCKEKRLDYALAQRGKVFASPVDIKSHPIEKTILPPPILGDSSEVVDKLTEAGASYDPAQLPLITPYLSSQHQQIREAALNAVILIGDPSASASLREVAKSLEDPREAVLYLEKADYLELPPFTGTIPKRR